MAQSPNIETVAKESFDKIHHELQTGKNFLASLFTKEDSYKDRQKYYDYLGKIEAQDITEADIFNANRAPDANRAGSRGRATPVKQHFQYRRRDLATLAASLHIEAVRAEAQNVGMSVDGLLNLKSEALEAAMERKAMEQILGLLTGSYRENPNRLTGTAATVIPFQETQRLYPLIEGTTTLSMKQLTPRDFFIFNAILDNSFGVNPQHMGGMRKELDSVKRIAICSNTWWAAFQYHNFEQGANRDFYGKDLQMGGYSLFLTRAGTMFVPIPDEFMPKSTDTQKIASATVATRAPQRVIGVLRGVDTPPTGAAATRSGLNRIIFCNPKVFQLKKPLNLDVPPIKYRDKDSSFEKGCYTEWATSGIRHYDEGVFEIYAPDYDNQTINRVT